MPTYIRPRRVDITEGGADIGALVLVAAGVLAGGAVVAFVLAHLVLLATAAAVFAAVMGAVAWWTRWLASPERLQEHRAAVAAPGPAQAIPAPRPKAIEAARTIPAQPGRADRVRIPRAR